MPIDREVHGSGAFISYETLHVQSTVTIRHSASLGQSTGCAQPQLIMSDQDVFKSFRVLLIPRDVMKR